MRLHALEHAAHLCRRLAIDVVEDQLGVAEDGIERRAQLVAHIGEELRLVLARDFELPALVLDLMEQARVLDCQHRLGGKGLQQIDRLFGKLAGPFAAHHESADDASAPSSGMNSSARKPARTTTSQDLGGRFLLHIGNLQRRALRGRLADTGIADVDVPLLDGGNQRFIHAVGGAQAEFVLVARHRS